MTHTPAPWMVEEGTTLIWGRCDPSDTSNNGMGYPIMTAQTVPSGRWAKGPNYGEAKANAYLVAAAPDMLEAAKALIAGVRSRHPGEPLHCPHMIALDAAIAKAKND